MRPKGGPALNLTQNHFGRSRIDLHVHSRYSEPSTDWYMQLWKIAESYSDPFLIYDILRKTGMSLFTLTDHNSIEGCLLLKERYGDEIIISTESTVTFPEDGCKIHLLIYGITESDFAEIQRLRRDIYELREFIHERKIAHSVAHATYPVQGEKLSVDHLEKLILLFDAFEVINGARNQRDNLSWENLLKRLTPECIENLTAKHNIEPCEEQPWIKGFTGGSDDHAAIFTGMTYTEARATGAGNFLEALKRKETDASGRHGDYRSLAYQIYKITYDYSQQNGNGSSSLMTQLSERLFEKKPLGLLNRVRIRRMKRQAQKSGNDIYRALHGLAHGIKESDFVSPEDALAFADSKIALISDECLRATFMCLEKDMAEVNLFETVRHVSAFLPGLFLLLPFLMTFNHIHGSRNLAGDLASSLGFEKDNTSTRILWFTDTINDLNGVSYTLREIASIAGSTGIDLKIVTSLPSTDTTDNLPPYIINLPSVYTFKLPYYSHCKLNIPSILNALRQMHLFDPDRIYISTPGPVGLMGLLGAKLMNTPCTGFYHTDFALQAKKIVEDKSAASMLESYTKWFYSLTDMIKAPTLDYIDILKGRGFDPAKLSIFRRGIDLTLFSPSNHEQVKPSFSHGKDKEQITLLYVGRVSRDKGLDSLLETYRKIVDERPRTRLLIVGDGPYLQTLMEKAKALPLIVFTGRIEQEQLPDLYRCADLFLFPSVTDTFGRAVLEAQACGLPAIVSNMGGPKENIIDGVTGFTARANCVEDFTEKVVHVINLLENDPEVFRRMRRDARKHVVECYRWEEAVGTIFEGHSFYHENARYERKIA
jgi:glycosyltransferase involved in cell wall biosynthesis